MTTTVKGETLPFSKLKPGMRVRSVNGPETGRLISKHNGSKTVKVALDPKFCLTEAGGVLHTRYENIEVLPTDPLDQIHPMLAKNVEDYKTLSASELLDDPRWALETKYDGERQILAFFPHDCKSCSVCSGAVLTSHDMCGDCGTVRFRATTRVVGKNTGVLGENTGKLPHLAKLPVPMSGPTVFDCELMHDGGFQTLRSIMGSDDELAIQKQEKDGYVHAVLFDVLWFGGRDLRGVAFKQRRKILESWYLEAEEYLAATHGIPDWPLHAFVAVSPIEWESDRKRRLLASILEAGGEGGMLKYGLGTYTDTTRPGQRSPHLLKVKPFQSDEFVICGFDYGKGEYNQDKIAVIRIGQWVHGSDLTEELNKRLVRAFENPALDAYMGTKPAEYAGKKYFVDMGTCGGFTQEQEAEFRKDPDSFIGKTVEVRYQQRWDDTGLMRHPSFVRLRGDKDSYECIFTPKGS